MRYEKIIRREDKSRVKITIKLESAHLSVPFAYTIEDVETCHYRKRKFQSVVDVDSFHYRRLNIKRRKEYRQKEFAKHVTPEEILQAKMELWEKLKP